MTDEEFRKILENVPRSYDDFVNGQLHRVTNDEDRQKMSDFIRDNPEANSGDVLRFYLNNIWNEEDDYDENTVFYYSN